MKIDSYAIKNDEKVVFDIMCDNSRCTANIGKIIVKLIRVIEFQGCSMIDYTDNIKHSFEEVLIIKELPRFPAGFKPLSGDDFHLHCEFSIDDKEILLQRKKKPFKVED
jgi:hypothetical protein